MQAAAGVVVDAVGVPIADMRVGIVRGTAPYPEIAAVTTEQRRSRGVRVRIERLGAGEHSPMAR